MCKFVEIIALVKGHCASSTVCWGCWCQAPWRFGRLWEVEEGHFTRPLSNLDILVLIWQRFAWVEIHTWLTPCSWQCLFESEVHRKATGSRGTTTRSVCASSVWLFRRGFRSLCGSKAGRGGAGTSGRRPDLDRDGGRKGFFSLGLQVYLLRRCLGWVWRVQVPPQM